MPEMVEKCLPKLPDQFKALEMMGEVEKEYGRDAVSAGLCEVAAALNQLVESESLSIDRTTAPFVYSKGKKCQPTSEPE